MMPNQLGAPSTRKPQGRPDAEAPWVEPYPDAELENLPDPSAGPDVRYELREAVRLAFIAAIQQLPPRQRAVLLLADVLGWSAIEVAAVLDASVASVNSALQRARAKLATLDRNARSVPMTNDHQRSLLERYVRAWESADLERFVALLKEDAVYSMPPWREWYQGRGSIKDFFGMFGPLIAASVSCRSAQTCSQRSPSIPWAQKVVGTPTPSSSWRWTKMALVR